MSLLRRRKRSIYNSVIDPDEVLLDATNLPSFNVDQFEGRVEKSIGKYVPLWVGLAIVSLFLVYAYRIGDLQIVKGDAYAILSAKNHLNHEIIFAERGIIYDRYGKKLAWNEPNTDKNGNIDTKLFALRKYIDLSGLSILLGFVQYPQKDANNYWWRKEYIGKAGIEKSQNDVLTGKNGVRLIEVNALEVEQSSNTIQKPVDGKNIHLTIDAQLQHKLFETIKSGVNRSHFLGGSGVIMDVKTGEVLALTSYPEYSSQVMTDGTPSKTIAAYSKDKRKPFLNRAVSGEYTPGSIVKPYVASAALQEKIISPYKKILSTGEIRVPNPYDPKHDSVFKDWKAHGWVDMRRAIAVSSNVYFYTVGGGFGGQKGLGIAKLAAYAARFGFGIPTEIEIDGEARGVVPTPAWKRTVFGDRGEWRLGDTYHTAIGQFGFLVTPIQAVRYVASVANGGKLLSPHILSKTKVKSIPVGVDDKNLQIVREGMIQGALKGTARAANVKGIDLAGKTGTAQLGNHNEYMNSWVMGFWPAHNPRFAFAVVLEKAPAHTPFGAAPTMNAFFRWLVDTQPEYTSGQYPTPEK